MNTEIQVKRRAVIRKTAAIMIMIFSLGAISSCTGNGTTQDPVITGKIIQEIQFEKIQTHATEAEKERAIQIYKGFMNDLSTFPISFKIGETYYHGLGSDFSLIKAETRTIGQKQGTLLVLMHTSGLELTLDCAFYPNYAAFEWTGYFKNTGGSKSPVIAEIHAADVVLSGENAVLNGLVGDAVNPDIGTEDGQVMNYQPYTIQLPEGPTEFASVGGRPTDTCFPYYDFQYGDGGALIAVGWPGQWKASFTRHGSDTVFKAGQQTFEAYLNPEETIQMPLIAFVLYDGRDEDRAANIWRGWFIDCNMRQVNGGLLEPAFAGWSGNACMTLTSERIELNNISVYERLGIDLDYWWMDAGWYFIDFAGNSCKEVPDYSFTGTWTVDTNRFPSSLKKITEKMQSIGGKSLLWFEPERFGLNPADLKDDGSTIRKEWLLPSEHNCCFVNFGVPEAVDWMTNKVSSVIDESGAALYREDFNVPPLSAWTSNDTEDRRGITENLYIQGHLKFWDNLIERYPDMMIDSCASGGRRNDLTSMRRAVPLHLSDFYTYGTAQIGGVNQSIYKWFPYFKNWGTSDMTMDPDPYMLLSHFAPMVVFCINPRADQTADREFLKAYQDWHNSLGEFFYADYYPLTKWSASEKDWAGWMFFDPEKGGGFIQMSRHADNHDSAMKFQLKGLNAQDHYILTDFNGNCGGTFTGAELLENGFTVVLPEAKSATLIKIERSSNYS